MVYAWPWMPFETPRKLASAETCLIHTYERTSNGLARLLNRNWRNRRKTAGRTCHCKMASRAQCLWTDPVTIMSDTCTQRFKPTKGTGDRNGQKKCSQIILLLHGISELQLMENNNNNKTKHRNRRQPFLHEGALLLGSKLSSVNCTTFITRRRARLSVLASVQE